MRIVRFQIIDKENLPGQWGVLVDDRVHPLWEAPAAAGLPAAESLSGDSLALAAVRLLAPVLPRTIICVGRNYAEHAAELGNEVPPEPLVFLKPVTVVIGPGEPVVYPAISRRVDHEAELAVVIGRRCRYLRQAEAGGVIFGYTLANDVTARDLQKSDGQWTRGKGFDTFGPIGPWIETDYDPKGRWVRCHVNGELRQNGNTDLMIYSIPHILAHITAFMTLEAGDVVLTGTPAGVGPVVPGDMMTVEIEGLGSLSNPVIAQGTHSAESH